MAMIPEPFKTLWKDATFANLLRALPTVLTSSLFMAFGLLEVAMACLKWTLFLAIMAMTFALGFVLLVVAVVGLVVAFVDLTMEAADAEVQEKAVEGPELSDKEDEVEQRVVCCTASDLGLGEEEQDITDQEAKGKATDEEKKKRLDDYFARTDPQLRDLDKKTAIKLGRRGGRS